MSLCPCGSNAAYKNCCEKYIKGVCLPETAEQLMRSRYSAYVRKEIDYIMETTLPEKRENISREETQKWAEDSDWMGLQIVETQNDGKTDETGTVEFKAFYKTGDSSEEHHEISRLKKMDGRWFFESGKAVPKIRVRESAKVGRNEPCPCDSGRKFKHCCLK